MPRILVADDHAIAKRGLKEILLEGFPTAEITTVDSTEALMEQVTKHSWDIVVCDIKMPGRSGLDALHEIKAGFSHLPVLIISFHSVDEYGVRVIKAGASGFLNKDDAVEDELIRAVNTIISGRKYITPSVAEKLALELSGDKEKEPHELLSDREFDVFKLIASGKSTGEIARQLLLSANTIGTFRSRVLAKMNMKNNAELVAYAVIHNLI